MAMHYPTNVEIQCELIDMTGTSNQQSNGISVAGFLNPETRPQISTNYVLTGLSRMHGCMCLRLYVICMYIYICMYTCVCMYVCINACMNIHTQCTKQITFQQV